LREIKASSKRNPEFVSAATRHIADLQRVIAWFSKISFRVFARASFGSFRYFRLDGLGTIHNFAVVIGDIEVKNVLFSVHSGKSHNIEQMLVVLDGLYANGTPLPEMLGYVVMLGIDPRVVSGRLDHNRFCKRRAITLHVRHALGPLLANERSNT
jgi:hypothetical protein